MALLPRALFVVAVLLLFPHVGASVPVMVGGLPAPPDSVPSLGLRTYVNLSHPANGDGEVSEATFIWSAAPCASAAKVKFFRRTDRGQFSTLTLLAERGPFDVNFVTETVALSPPVPVHAGDLVGVTNLTECGTVTLRSLPDNLGEFEGDVEGSVQFLNAPELQFFGALELRANSSDLEAVANILPVAISGPGQSGASFKTRIQLRNPQGVGRITGRLVFHPAFASAGPSDPSLPYSLGAWEVQTIEDFLGALSMTGIGSVDVIPSSGLGPTIQATVYSPAPGGGSVGFSEPMVRPAEIIGPPGTFIGPADPSRSRLNIGIRTLDKAVTITVVAFDSTGFGFASTTRTYPPNYFEQVPASVFLNGGSLAPNTSFKFSGGGDAIIYGVVADNVSQNASILFLTPDL
jgi:hypothetical protein